MKARPRFFHVLNRRFTAIFSLKRTIFFPQDLGMLRCSRKTWRFRETCGTCRKYLQVSLEQYKINNNAEDVMTCDQKTLAFHTFCLCLWTLTKIPSLKCRSMKMGKLYGTLSCLTDLSTVIDGVRCCMELTPSVPIPFAWHPSIRSLRLQILQLLICKVSHLQAFNHPKSRNLDPPLGTRCWSCSYCAGFNVIKG